MIISGELQISHITYTIVDVNTEIFQWTAHVMWIVSNGVKK